MTIRKNESAEDGGAPRRVWIWTWYDLSIGGLVIVTVTALIASMTAW